MKRVLAIAPAFPPHPSPAAHRVRYLSLHGARFGCDVHVVSVDPAFYEEPPDWELAGLVPAGTDVVRTSAWPSRWTRRLGIGDLGIRAYVPMRRAVAALCRRHRPDVIFLSAPPWHTFRIGLDMRRQHGVPYVLDYTDPWVFALAPGQDRPWRKAYWFRRLALALEPHIARAASHILAVSDATHDGLRARCPDIPPSRFSAVPFGFEPGDFEYLRRHPRHNALWNQGDGLIHVVNVGAVPPQGYDTIRAFFDAVSTVRREAPDLARRLRVHFVGTSYDPAITSGLVTPLAHEAGIGDIVTEHPRRVPYADALNALCAADVLVTLGSSEAHYTASRIFPYLLADRPLLAVYHEENVVCDIVRAWGGAQLVTYSNAFPAATRSPDIAAALGRAVTHARSSAAPGRGRVLDDYSAERCTERVCEVLIRAAAEPADAGCRRGAGG